MRPIQPLVRLPHSHIDPNWLSTVELRNLSDVFGENDPVRRRAAIDEIFHEDAVFYDPKGGIFRGRDEIDRIAGVIKATTNLRGNRFYRRPERRIASVYLFFDNLP